MLLNCPGAVRSPSKVSVLLAWLMLSYVVSVVVFQFRARGAQEPSTGHVLSTEANLVVLPVTVRDRRGQFVSNLDKSNFHVYEDGKIQNITLFRNQDVPATVGLVVDHSASMAAKQLQVIEAAQTFVQASNPQDREFVVNFSDTVSLALPGNVAFSNDVEFLRSALSIPFASGRTALYDALLVAMEHFEKNGADRKVLLLVSDGGDNASKHNFSQVLRTTQTDDVIIYAIGLFDVNSADSNPRILKKLADETGGRAYFPSSYSELLNACRNIALDIRHQYILGYAPPGTSHPGYRRIRVRVATAGHGKLFVRTRPGYYYVPPPARSQPATMQGFQ